MRADKLFSVGFSVSLLCARDFIDLRLLSFQWTGLFCINPNDKLENNNEHTSRNSNL